MNQDKQCACCPLATIFEMATKIQKAKIRKHLESFKEVKQGHPLLDLTHQLN